MTQKDFRLIAEVVAAEEDEAARARICAAFAVRLRADNPCFKPELFARACNAVGVAASV